MGKYKQRQRQHYIDVARLMGYTIIVSKDAHNWRYNLVLPNGELHHTPMQFARMFPTRALPITIQYKFMWQAAMAAIELEGIDARTLKPPREDRARSGRVPEVFDERNKLERVRN